MHERNPYRDNVDFRLLAEAYPPLRPFVFSTSKGTPGIDFKNAEAQRELTQALLHRDFGLEMHSLPNDRLCPPIPNRLDYVLWIQDIVDEVAELDSGAPSVLGIDVGTGASAIYTLLACRLRSNWKMIGTDIDKNSFASAEKNVTANRLQEQITLHLSKPDERIFTPIFENPDKRFSFTMCNPPFYSTFSEAVNSPVIKEFDPFAVCTGAEVEMVTEGGEVGFVRRMILESKELKERCRWYTSLLGKSSSVPPLIEALKEQKVNNYGITELVQSHTKRWVILWSYGDIRLPDALCRLSRGHFAGSMPLPNNLLQAFPGTKASTIFARTLEVLASLPSVRWTNKSQERPNQRLEATATATANCWSRASRRKAGTFSNEGPGSLTCQLEVTSDGTSGSNLHCQWVRGRDRDLFDSFWSHVARKVTDKQ